MELPQTETDALDLWIPEQLHGAPQEWSEDNSFVFSLKHTLQLNYSFFVPIAKQRGGIRNTLHPSFCACC